MLLFCNDTATTALYTYGHTLSLHVALPICRSDNRLPACLVDHFHAKRLGLGQLAASAGPGNDQIGLGRNRARYLRAKRLGLRLGFIAAHRLKRSGDHHRLAAHPRRPFPAPTRPWEPLLHTPCPHSAIVRAHKTTT